MSSAPNDIIATIRQTVIEHYKRDDSRPLLLSDLGTVLRKQNRWPIDGNDGKSLRQVIEGSGDQEILIVRDERSPAYIVVSTAAAKPQVEAAIMRRHQTTSEVPDLTALPRSVVLAFCQSTNDGGPVYLQAFPPYKYKTNIQTEKDSDQYLKIEEKYRRPMVIATVEELTAQDKLSLQSKIAAWSKDNGISIQRFYKDSGQHRLTALERLILAQPAGLAAKIMVPADIALILSKHE